MIKEHLPEGGEHHILTLWGTYAALGAISALVIAGYVAFLKGREAPKAS